MPNKEKNARDLLKEWINLYKQGKTKEATKTTMDDIGLHFATHKCSARPRTSYVRLLSEMQAEGISWM